MKMASGWSLSLTSKKERSRKNHVFFTVQYLFLSAQYSVQCVIHIACQRHRRY